MISALLQLLEWMVNGFGVGGQRFPRHVLFFSVGWGGLTSMRLIRAALRAPATHPRAGIAFGGGRYALSRDYWLVGGHGEGGGASVRESGRRVQAGGGSGGMDVGYLLLEAGRARLYALGTVGGMGAGVTAAPATVVQAKATGGFTGLLLFGGLGLDYRIPLYRTLGLAVGVRFGWLQPALTIRMPRRRIGLPRLGSPRLQIYVGLSSDPA